MSKCNEIISKIMMANMKAALQILDKSPHWKHPILQHNSHQMHCEHYYIRKEQ